MMATKANIVRFGSHIALIIWSATENPAIYLINRRLNRWSLNARYRLINNTQRYLIGNARCLDLTALLS
jgi:hypothetical protein